MSNDGPLAQWFALTLTSDGFYSVIKHAADHAFIGRPVKKASTVWLMSALFARDSYPIIPAIFHKKQFNLC